MDQLNILHTVIGILGLLLIVNTILVLIYPSYFSRLSKTFFIEPLSDDQKEKAREFVEKNKNSDRYLTSIVSFGLAIVAIAWSIGKVESVTLPFIILAVLILISRYFLKKRGK